MAGSASSLPPAVGDWVVDVDTTVTDLQLQVNGSLWVVNGSSLSLTNTTLAFHSVGGEHVWVNVSSSSALTMVRCTVDQADPGTIVRGAIAGVLRMEDSRWSHMDARPAPIATGVLVADGGIVEIVRSTLDASPAAFTLASGNIRIADSSLRSFTRAAVLGATSLSGDSGILVQNVTAENVTALFAATCAGCSGNLTITLEDYKDGGNFGYLTSLVFLNGSGSFDRLTVGNFGVTTTAANRSFLQVDYRGVQAFVHHVENSTSGPGFSPFAYAILQDLKASAAVAVVNSSSSSFSGYYTFLYSNDSPVSVLVDRVRAERFSISAATSGAVRLVASNSTFGNDTGRGLFLSTNSGQASVELSNSTLGAGVKAGLNSFGLGLGRFISEPPSPLELTVADCDFLNTEIGMQVDVPMRLTLSRTHFFNLEGAVNATASSSSPSFANVSFHLSNLTFSEVRMALNLSSSAADGLPVHVTMEDISTVGRGAGLLNFTGTGATLFRFSNITATGSGLEQGIWIRYGGRLNVSVTHVWLENFLTAVHIERLLASGPADTWQFDNLTVRSGAFNGLDLIAGAPLGAEVSIVDSSLWATWNTLSFVRVAVNISRCSIGGLDSHVYNQDGVVILRETTHNSHAVSIDARNLSTTRLESWDVLGLRVVWAANGLAPTGWRLELPERLGAQFLEGTLDEGGRLFEGTREVLLYRFTANFSDYDARATAGNLTLPGRPSIPVTLDLTGNISDVLLSVVDPNAPAIVVEGERDGTVYFNKTSFTLRATFWDPETGVGAGNISVLNRTVFDRRDLAGTLAFTWNVTSALSTPAEGFYTLIVVAKDLTGNEFQLYLLLDIDLTPPTIVPMLPTPGGSVNFTDFTLRVVSDPDTDWVLVAGTSATLGGGSWELPVVFLEGSHTVQIEAVDFAGNRRVLLLSFAVDLTPPQPRVIGLADGMATNLRVLPFAVEKDIGDVVLADGVLFTNDSTTLAASFSIPFGTTTHTLIVVDRAGNVATFSYQITLDLDAPSLSLGPGISPGATLFLNRSSFTLVATTDSDAYFVEAGGFQFTPNALGEARIGLTLPEGSHSLAVSAVDRAGNRRTIPITVVIDLTPPELLSSDPSNGARLNKPSIVLRLDLSEAADVIWTRGTVSGFDGVVNLTFDIQSGTNRFTFVLIDRAGNHAPALVELIGDFKPPSLSITSPANDSRTAQAEVRLGGVAEPGSRVFVNGFEIAVAADGSFAVDVPLAPGQNTIAVLARDEAGNEAFQTIEVTRGDDFGGTLAVVAIAATMLLITAGAILVLRRQKSPTDKGPRPPSQSG